MLSRKNRLNKKEVDLIFKNGKSYKTELFLLKIKKEEKPSSVASRFAVVVPVKVSKKSTERNRIKRKIRESLRNKIPKIKNGIQAIIIALPDIKEKNYKGIDDGMKKIIITSKIKK